MSGLYLVADDLTGALDSAVAFCGRLGPIPVFLGAPHDLNGPHAAVDLATRDVHADVAVARTFLVADRLAHADIAFKKIDSRLRGNWSVELAALMRSGAFDLCVMAPAFPAQGRITLNGRQFVCAPNGSLVMEPVDPIAILRGLGLTVVAGKTVDAAAILEALSAIRVEPVVLIFDASTDDELETLVAGVMQRQGRPGPVLWCGAAGLSKALAPQSPPAARRMARPLLAVVGTNHPATREQMAVAIAAGIPHRSVGADALDEAVEFIGARFRRAHSCLIDFDLPLGVKPAEARALIERRLCELLPLIPRPASLVATGGETLLSICSAVSANHLEVDAEASHGVPHSWLRGGLWEGVEVLSKSGGFGASGWLIDVAR
jgi:uncharacterized protein YgbK (DUF1537 family)